MVNVTVAQLSGHSRGTRFYSWGTCLGWPHLGAATVESSNCAFGDTNDISQVLLNTLMRPSIAKSLSACSLLRLSLRQSVSLSPSNLANLLLLLSPLATSHHLLVATATKCCSGSSSCSTCAAIDNAWFAMNM